MMFDRPTISHQPPTPPGSPNPPSPSQSPALTGGVVRAELAQQANEVCQLVAKANRAPNGLHADELRRLLTDIHSLHLLAQQLSSTSSTSSSSSSSPSRGIAKKKPSHRAAVLSRPLAAFSSPAWCATSSPPAPTAATTTTTTSAAAAAPAGRACHTPIRPRGHLPTAATTATNSTSGSSSCLSPEIGTGPRACTNCGTSTTVQWRCGADGKPSLCNACGLRYRYNLKKKALYEDIAVVRAMTQRSPPFAQHANNQHNHTQHTRASSPSSSSSSSSSSSASASPSSSASASRSPSPSPPPPVPSAAGCPPRPAPAAISAPPADASGEARRSNIYSLLN